MSDPPSRRERLRRHLRLIDEGVAPVVARYGDQMQCRPGCSECCGQTFTVSELEGDYLREGLAALDADTRADILERAARWQPDRREPCPVLGDDGCCRMYEHRPRVCRKYGIPLWHPDRPHEVRCCPLNFQGQGEIDAELFLDPQARWAEAWIELRAQLGMPPQQDRTIAEHLLAAAEPVARRE